MKSFINLFVDKKYQDCLLFENSSLKKRSKFFSRFAHNADAVLDNDAIILRTNNLSKELLEDAFGKLKIRLPQYGTVFALCQESMKLSYDRALSYLDETYGECIVMFDNGCAIVKEETDIGTPEKFVLYGDHI